MKLINRFLTALALLCTAGCTNAKNQTVELPDNAVLLDVRSVEEFQSGHLPGAVNLPLPEISAKAADRFPDRNVPLYLYCRSGRRSENARRILQDAGYSNVHNLGGFEEAGRKLNMKADIQP